MHRWLYPLFQNQSSHFLLSCPFWKLSQTSGQGIYKMVSKHTIDYHPSPSKSISRIHPLIFLWTPKEFISPVSFLNFFLVYSIMVAEKFQIYSVQINANAFVSQKLESVHYYSCPQSKTLPQIFIIIPQGDKNCLFLLNSVFWRRFFPRRNEWGRGLWSWKYHQN